MLWSLSCDGHWEATGSRSNSEEDEMRRQRRESILVQHFEEFPMPCVVMCHLLCMTATF
jgi:hypothetical protein